MDTNRVKAVVLFSGGLDSILASQLILDQGIDLEGVNFKSVFLARNDEALPVADKLKLRLKVFDITGQHIQISRSPAYGHGKNMNPCLDCRIIMLKKAAEYMKETGASFLVTGEVLGERPMSQRKEAFSLIEKAAGLKGRILRPLSAKLLEPTIPEIEGLVKREELLDIQGRSRSRQMELAEQRGIDYYPTPAGGCLLTDPGFSNRLKELFNHLSRPSVNDIRLLKYGRHFRMPNNIKIIIARDDKEVNCLLELVEQGDLVFELADQPGPITTVRAKDKDVDLGWVKDVAALTARYSKLRDKKEVRVKYYRVPQKKEEFISVNPQKAEELGIARIC